MSLSVRDRQQVSHLLPALATVSTNRAFNTSKVWPTFSYLKYFSVVQSQKSLIERILAWKDSTKRSRPVFPGLIIFPAVKGTIYPWRSHLNWTTEGICPKLNRIWTYVLIGSSFFLHLFRQDLSIAVSKLGEFFLAIALLDVSPALDAVSVNNRLFSASYQGWRHFLDRATHSARIFHSSNSKFGI